MTSSFDSRTLRRLAILGAALLITACGSSNDGPNTSGTRVALFINGGYVDFDTSDYGSEASNLMFAFQARGFTVDTFSSTDSTAVAAILAQADVLVFPENEGDTGLSNLPTNTFAAIEAFVTGGGTMAVFRNFDYLNTPFGLTLVNGGGGAPDDRFPLARAASAGDTPFDGPTTIPANDATDYITQASAPGGTIPVYVGYDGNTDISVGVIPHGSGRIVYFGWDYYDGKPFGLQDGGWYKLLDGLAGF